MKKFEYKVVVIPIDRIWTGKADVDYFLAISDLGKEGWEFVAFVPGILTVKGNSNQELLFKREILED